MSVQVCYMWGATERVIKFLYFIPSVNLINVRIWVPRPTLMELALNPLSLLVGIGHLAVIQNSA